MKSKRRLAISIYQLAVGLFAVAAFIILAIKGENMTRWIGTMALSLAFIWLGITGIIEYKSGK